MDRRSRKLNFLQWTLCVILILCCLCNCLEIEKDLDVASQNGHCSSDDKSETGCSENSNGDKYSKDNNVDIGSNSSSSDDANLNQSDINTNKEEMKDQGTADKTVELTTGMKTLQIPILDGVKVGHVQEVEIMPGVTRQIKTLSMYPPIFEIPDFLTPIECDLIVAMADRKGMSPIRSKISNDGITFEDLNNTFKTWDSNNDGFVDPEEIILLPGKIDLKFSEKDVVQMFKDLEMDKDGNGKIDWDEFKNTDLVKLQEYIKERLKDDKLLRNPEKDMAWLWHDEDELLRYQPEFLAHFHERLEAVTKIPKEIIKQSEPLRVLSYDENSYGTCQQDSEPNVGSIPCCQYGDTKQCRLCRFITVSYFLNDVDKGGEMVFPHANSKFEEDIMGHSGNWSGFFTFAKTTGSRNKFNVHLTFKTEGANKVVYGRGQDDSGEFEFVDSLVAHDIVRFRKKYTDNSGSGGGVEVVKYAGRIKGGATIEGKWWVPGQPRMNGNFFMYSTEYEKWMDRTVHKCNSHSFCTKGNLVIKPKKGTAIMWYNHMTNDDHWIGAINDKSYHGNCDVIEGEKWTATSWINVIGDGNVTLKAWKNGRNWLSATSRDRYPEMITKLSGDKPKLDDLIEEMFNKDMVDPTLKPTDDKPPERHVLNAVTSLLEVLDKEGITAVSKKVHQKLQMTCIPLFMNKDGQIRVVDGSKEN